MFDAILIGIIAGQRCRDDAALRMADQRHALIAADTRLPHGFDDHTCAVCVTSLHGIGAHELHILLPSQGGVEVAVGSRNGHQPGTPAIGIHIP